MAVETSLCLVTAFKDLSRGSWKSFCRSNNEYFRRFEALLDTSYPLVVFIEEQYGEHIKGLVANIRGPSNVWTHIILINDEFQNNNIHAYKLLERERAIMSSEEYQQKIAHRRHHPEHCVPEYTIINHCKIDFVDYVMNKLQHAIRFEKYGWIDFGYMEDRVLPHRNNLNIDSIDNARVNYVALQVPGPDDGDIEQNLVKAPDRFAGAFFAGGQEALTQYRALYHDALEYFAERNIADDDQAVTLSIYHHHPELFRLKVGDWKGAFQVYGKLQPN